MRSEAVPWAEPVVSLERVQYDVRPGPADSPTQVLAARSVQRAVVREPDVRSARMHVAMVAVDRVQQRMR